MQEHRGIPVVFLTAHADVATLSRVSALKPAGYIVKPYRQSELQAALERARKSSKRR